MMGKPDRLLEVVDWAWGILERLTQEPGVVQRYSTGRIRQDPAIEMRIALALRSMADREIAQSSDAEWLEALDLETFIVQLVGSWEEHNAYCDTLDLYLTQEPDNGTDSEELRELSTKYTEMLRIDQRKRTLSCRIKPVLQRFVERVATRLSAQQLHRVLTPSKPSFWTLYREMHAQMGSQEVHRRRLLRMFHRDCPELLAFRLKHDPLLTSDATSGRHRRPERDEKAERIQEDPIIAAIDLLLCIDNCCEPLWVKSLVGIPDYYLRERLVSEIHRCGGKNLHVFDHVGIMDQMRVWGISSC